MRRILTALALAGLVVTPGHAADRRIRVVDGDTLKVGRDRLRIENLDAPDIGSHARCALEEQRGLRSKAYASELVERGPVIIRPIGRRDRYGRELVRVTIGNRDFAGLMVEAGQGRPWRGRSSDWCRS